MSERQRASNGKVTKWFEKETTVTRKAYERPKKGMKTRKKKTFIQLQFVPFKKWFPLACWCSSSSSQFSFFPRAARPNTPKLQILIFFLWIHAKLWEVTFQQFHFIPFDGVKWRNVERYTYIDTERKRKNKRLSAKRGCNKTGAANYCWNFLLLLTH